MAEKIVLDAEIKTGSAEGSVKSLKTQLKEAQAEVAKMADLFGHTSEQAIEAAKRAAELKDRIGDAKTLTDAFNPDAKFKALGGALQGVAGGFSAFQGAMATFGTQSEAVEQTLLKVQGAMAMSQGLNALGEARDSFATLGKQAVKAFESIKGAIGGFGLGVLTVGIAGAIALWDNFKSKVSSAKIAQDEFNSTQKDYVEGAKKAYEDTSKVKVAFDLARKGVITKEEALKTYNDTLGDSLGKTNNLNEAEALYASKAKTYIEIQGKKAQANALFAKAAEYSAKQIEIQAKAEKYASGATKFAEEAAKKFGTTISAKDRATYENITGVTAANKKAAKEIEETQNIANKLTDAAEKNLEDIEKLSKEFEINTDTQIEANKEKDKELDESAKKEEERKNRVIEADKEYEKQIRNAKQEAELLKIKDETERAKKKLQFDFENQKEEINQSEASEDKKNSLIAALRKKLNLDKAKIDEEANKKEEKRQQEFTEKLNKLRADGTVAGVKREFELKRIEQQNNFNAELLQIKNDENLKENEKFQLIAQLQLNNAAKLRAIDQEEAKKRADVEKETFDMQFNARMNSLKDQAQKRQEIEAKRFQEELDKQLELLNNKEITEDDYNKRREALQLEHQTNLTSIEKQNAEERKANAEKEFKHKQDLLNAYGSLLGNLSDAIGRDTAVGKAFAIAKATMDTYVAANSALKADYSIFGPVGQVARFAAVAATIATGIKNVKSIAATKVPGASGGGGNANMPSMPTAAPIGPQMSQTALNQQMINQMGNAASRAFVLESDVSGNQERIRRLNRAARIN